MKTTETIELRAEIAKLEKEQRITKENRKDTYFTGERVMSPYDAAMKVPVQREQLRFMYAAYGLLRGHDFSVTEAGNNELLNYGYGLVQVNKILEKYGYTMPYVEKKSIFGKPVKVIDTENYAKIIRLDRQES